MPLIRPASQDLRLIFGHLGVMLAVFGVTGSIPLAIAVINREWKEASGFVLMLGLAVFVGGVMRLGMDKRRRPMRWAHGMALIALAWLIAPVFAAIPLAESGHYNGWLDAFFDAVSGLTTTGLTVVQDNDHMAVSIHVWRHLLQFLGGGGIAVAFLTLYPTSGAVLYHSEARDLRFLPSAGSTARFIWRITLVYTLVGVGVLWVIGISAVGFGPGRALFHAFTIFTAGFSTGGFAPMSTSIGYYHSFLFELVTITIMLAGATNFALHYRLWHKQQRLVLHDLELKTYLGLLAATATTFVLGLAITNTYDDVGSLLRQGLFQALSAQTTTGFSTVSVSQLSRIGGLAATGFLTAMALGSMSMSTGGGVKALRVGLTLKAIFHEVRASILPPSVISVSTWEQAGERRRLTPDVTVGVMTISLLFVGAYLLGAAVGIAYGYPLDQALFESISAAGTVGLSVGITSPTMPAILEVIYILEMWVGRLEFIAIISFIGYLIAVVAGD